MNQTDQKIRVGLVGAGCMGRGIAIQIQATPGMSLEWVADLDTNAARSTANFAPGAIPGTHFESLLNDRPIDVLVEATNSIAAAADYCRAALHQGAHIVLMNAEVDLAFGSELAQIAASKNLIVTSDAGDQHGVLASMISEADLMGFEVVQAGNIKGFLDRRATPESIEIEAAKRNLSPTQCCAYTDGTKLHIEMAVLANALGYQAPAGGMQGPRAQHVHEALNLFDFDSYHGTPRIDYLLGAEPGGGVYLVVKSKDGIPSDQQFYLKYYKLPTSRCGRFHLLYRPYHLCHLETPKAIIAAASGQAILSPRADKTCEVHAYAKTNLAARTEIKHAIGSAEVYGLVEAPDPTRIPITKLEAPVRLTKAVTKDTPLSPAHFE